MWKEAGKKGRQSGDIILMIVTLIVAYFFLLYGSQLFDGQVEQNTVTWIIAGGLIGLGMIVPGLESLEFFSLYGVIQGDG